jgi:hypothetical protein
MPILQLDLKPMTPHLQRINPPTSPPYNHGLIHRRTPDRPTRRLLLLPSQERFLNDLALSADLDRLHVSEKVCDFDLIDVSAKEVCADAGGGVDEVSIVRVEEVFHCCLRCDVDVFFEEFEVIVRIPIDDRHADVCVCVVLLSAAQQGDFWGGGGFTEYEDSYNSEDPVARMLGE